MGFSGFLQIVHVAVDQFDGGVNKLSALIQEIISDEPFVISRNQVVQSFPAGASGVAAVFGVVHVVETAVEPSAIFAVVDRAERSI